MTVAVGRLQFTITMAAPRTPVVQEPQPETQLEHAFRIQQLQSQVANDRARWTTSMLERAGRPF